MVKKLDAQIAAVIITATAFIAAAQKKSWVKKDNITNEIFPKVINITFCFISMPQKKIIQIFHNKLKLINLYQLHPMRGFHFDIIYYHD